MEHRASTSVTPKTTWRVLSTTLPFYAAPALFLISAYAFHFLALSVVALPTHSVVRSLNFAHITHLFWGYVCRETHTLVHVRSVSPLLLFSLLAKKYHNQSKIIMSMTHDFSHIFQHHDMSRQWQLITQHTEWQTPIAATSTTPTIIINNRSSSSEKMKTLS